MHRARNTGFTLVETIVAIGLFTIVLFIATSAFLSIVNADRKSRAVRIATDNLNLALEDMSRRIKTGWAYDCGATGAPTDCTGGADESVSFTTLLEDGITPVSLSYKRAVGPTECGGGFSVTQGCIVRSDNIGPVAVTSPEIDITSLHFIVRGTAVTGDTNQPSVLVSLSGSLSSGPNTPATTFKIQTLVTQRAYDA